MIRVERDQNDAAGNPILPLGTWIARANTKTQDAIDDGPTHQVTDLYKEDNLRAALEKLFHNKCAYCESHGLAGFPWDVEHYRPKGRVAEDTTHPGYYWLAYTWTNCIRRASSATKAGRTSRPSTTQPPARRRERSISFRSNRPAAG